MSWRHLTITINWGFPIDCCHCGSLGKLNNERHLTLFLSFIHATSPPSAGDYILDSKPKEISEAQRLNYEQVNHAFYSHMWCVYVEDIQTNSSLSKIHENGWSVIFHRHIIWSLSNIAAAHINTPPWNMEQQKYIYFCQCQYKTKHLKWIMAFHV